MEQVATSRPYSPEAEAAVLGCVLIDPVASMDVLEARITDPEIFYDVRNRTIYEAFVELARDGVPIEFVAVLEKIRNSSTAAASSAYLAQLLGEAPPASSVGYYLQTLLEKWSLRRVIALSEAIIAKASEPCDDVGGLLSTAASELATVADSFAAPGESSVTYKQAVIQAIEILGDRWKNGGAISGLTTGMKGLDTLLSGLHPGELIVVGARPSQGKTALGCGIADQVALASGGNRVLVFSLEMPASQLALRSLSSLASVDVRQMMKGVANERDFRAINAAGARLARAAITIEDQPGLRIGQISARARKIHRKTPLSLVVVDYLQLVSPDRQSDSRVNELTEVSAGLKRLARELNVPVIALCQLNRSSDKENRKPRMSDLRDCGAIEQDADVVILIHQQPSANKETPQLWDTELIVAKQRNGPTDTVHAQFNRPFTRFEDKIELPSTI